MMAFWRVWAALNQSVPLDPVYVRLLDRGKPQRHYRTVTQRILESLPYVALVFVCAISLTGRPLGLMAFMGLMVLPVVVVFSAGIFIGTVMAFRVSFAVTLEQQQRRDDLLGVTPMGVMGALWLLVYLIYNRSKAIPRVLDFTRDLLQAALYLCMALGMVVVVVVIFDSQPTLSAVLLTIGAFSLVIAIYADMMQSTVLGLCVGLIVPAYTRDPLSARILAVGAFWTMQVMVYAAALVVSGWLPTFFDSSSVMGLFLLSVGRLVGLLGTRQVLIALLWMLIPRYYESDLREWRGAVGI